jgi:hypothetical protein
MTQVDESLIEKIKEAQKGMQQIQTELGAISLVKIREEFLFEEYKKLQAVVEGVSAEVRAEHGDGSVNLENGEFTPTEVAAE